METLQQGSANSDQNLFELQIDQQSISYLGETAKWAKFLSIVGFVMCGLMVIFALFAGTIIVNTISKLNPDQGLAATGMGGFFSIIYLVIALIYFFPCLYLFNYASKMQVALRNNDQINLNKSFGHLKSLSLIHI